jgi:excisionase family DNA binding protein
MTTNPMRPETYSTRDAARILAISERRVRQLVDEGKLPGSRDKAGSLRISRVALEDERLRRRETGRKRAPSFPREGSDLAATLSEIISSAVAAAVVRVLEVASSGDREIASELAEQRLRVQRLEAEVARLRSPPSQPPGTSAGITPARPPRGG